MRRYVVRWVDLTRMRDRRPFLWKVSEKGLEELRLAERKGRVRILDVIRVE